MSASQDNSGSANPPDLNSEVNLRPRTPEPANDNLLRSSASSSPLSSYPTSLVSEKFFSPIPLRTAPLQSTSFGGDGANDTHTPSTANSQVPTLSFNESFSSSRRTTKNGEPVVVDSDGEDANSISSLESVGALMRKFNPRSGTSESYDDSGTRAPINQQDDTGKGRPSAKATSQSKRNRHTAKKDPPEYKFSLDMLVTDAVDDQEAENNVRKARTALEESEALNQQRRAQQKMSREGVLSSIADEDTDAASRQRLRDAIERTEAFDRGKRWAFFEESAPTAPPKFPHRSIEPGSWDANLKGRH